MSNCFDRGCNGCDNCIDPENQAPEGVPASPMPPTDDRRPRRDWSGHDESDCEWARRNWEALPWFIANHKAIRAAIAAQPQAPAWQPIETAPKDGFMLVHEDGAIRAMLRINGQWKKLGYPALIEPHFGGVLVGNDALRVLPAGYRLENRDGCCENPTHWMPLPAAPQTKEPTNDR